MTLMAPLLVSALAQAPIPTPMPTPAPGQPAAPGAAAPAAPDTRAAGDAGQDYRIGPGDILRVTVYGHDDLTQTVVVQPDGSFVFPLLGRIEAAQQTPMQIQAWMEKRLGKSLIRDPRVTVVVQEYRSKVVFVVGEVTHPGTYPLGGDTGVVEILARAGPLSPQAANEVVVVRPAKQVGRPVLPAEVAGVAGTGKGSSAAAARAEVLTVNLKEIQAGQLDKNLTLKPNDTVFVARADRIFVTGEVRNPGAIPFSHGLTVRQAVSLAGGFGQDASKGSAKVVRVVNGKTYEIKMRLDEPLQPGDTVVIKASLFW
jgi:polysaccharide export outer membrane protein